MTILFAFLAKYGAMLALALTSLFGVWYAGKTKGESKAKIEAAEQKAADVTALAIREVNEAKQAAETEVKKVSASNEVTINVAAMSDADVIAELRSNWQTKPIGTDRSDKL